MLGASSSEREITMIFEKKKTVAALKAAYNKGYEVHLSGDTLHIYAGTWSAVVEARQVPVEVSQIIVEHLGYLPTRPERVRKNEPGQLVLDGVTEWRGNYIAEQRDNSVSMKELPIIFRGKWQLFRSADGGVYAFDVDLLGMVNPDDCTASRISTASMGIFFSNDEMVMIAPGRFDEKDREKLRVIASLYAAPEYGVEEPENLSLFDDMEDTDDD